MGPILTRVMLLLVLNRPYDDELTDRLFSPGWRGNPWGPAAARAREDGDLPPIVDTPQMGRWDRWGRQALKDGDILFRLGDARIAMGYYRFSRFIAKASGSRYSHTGIVAIEDGEPVVYDTTKSGPRRQPLKVWVLDNAGPMGVKRLKPEFRDRIPEVLSFCRRVYQAQVPFDYELGLDDSAYYCCELTEKAFRAANLALSEPIRLGDMERAHEFPVQILSLQYVSSWLNKHPVSLEQRAFFPGNERHGIWSSNKLETVYDPPESGFAARSASEDPQVARH